MRTSSGDRPPTLQPHYRVYAAVVSRRTPLARVLGRGARGRTPWYLAGTCLNPPGLPPEGGRPYRSTARRRGAVTADPRVGRRVPVSNQADPIRRSGGLVQRGARPAAELALGGDRGPIRVVRSTQEPRRTRESKRKDSASVGPRPLEAEPSSTAVPKRCRGAKLSGRLGGRSCFEHLENPQWPVAISPRRSGMRARCRATRPPKRLAGSTGAVRAAPKRCESGGRLPLAEAG